MKILFASAEVAPIVKVGGLADVSGALPKAIRKLGHDIRIVMPKYQMINESQYPMKLKTRDILVEIGEEREKINIYQTTLPDSDVPVYLLENKKYLSKNGIYFEITSFANIQRFLFFSKAVLSMVNSIFRGRTSDFWPEIIHCQDWHTGILPLLVKLENLRDSPAKTLFTIHNLAVRGRWNWQQVMDFLGFKGDEHPNLQEKFIGRYGPDFDSIQQGILGADIINTVSPGYAREIMTKTDYAPGLAKTLRSRRKDFYGILNGIDVEVWNPAADSAIRANYSVKNLKAKKENKLALQKALGFTPDAAIPFLGMVSRLVDQKGVDLVCQAFEMSKFRFDSLGSPLQVVILGTGDPKIEKMVVNLAKKYPKKISTHIKFDAKLACQIYAGCDIFLMPSRFEPCGLGQLIAMRYGTIPVVRKTGGLRDTVRNVRITKKGFFRAVEGTGFVFNPPHAEHLLNVIRRALEFYKDKKVWQKIIINAMSQDFSWSASAEKYLELYRKLVEGK